MRCYVPNDGAVVESKVVNGKKVDVRDGMQVWEKRAPLIKKFLRHHEVDVCGSQELFKNQIEDMRDLEDVYGIFGTTTMPSRDKLGHKNHNNIIFYKKSRLELLESGVFWLSETPEKESLGWGAKYARNCNWGKFRDKKTGKIFFYFNTHFHHIGENVKFESAKLMVSKIREIAGAAPLFFTGDLNSGADSRAIAEIKNSGFLKDAREVCKTEPYGAEGTFSRYQPTVNILLDWIFVQNVEVEKYAVYHEIIDGVFLSDHYPVLAKVKIK